MFSLAVFSCYTGAPGDEGADLTDGSERRGAKWNSTQELKANERGADD